jgi:ATP-dependent Lon protease
LDETEGIMVEEEEKLLKSNMSELSYERRINLLNVSQDVKDKAIEKLKAMKTNIQGDGKAQSWLDGFLKIPFGSYRENKLMNFKKEFIKRINNNTLPTANPMTFDSITKYVSTNDVEMKKEWTDYSKERSIYLKTVHETLDKAVYGHKEAKLQLERLFAQWINGETKGAVIGLWGPPGTGKTSLVKNGLSKCLIDDDGKPRPFAFLPIGGSVNGSTLVGHNFTYVGSTWGRIADITMTSNCMNPIIFIDEVDKISNTEYGKEIVSVLTHLTDATQNDNFEDKYFSGIPLDLSKSLIVFSFNDITLLDPILRDRITIIETKPYTLQEKIHIIIKYMLPEVLSDVGYNNDEIKFTDEIVTYIINSYTNEAGVRKVKEKIVEIVRDINSRFYIYCPIYCHTRIY